MRHCRNGFVGGDGGGLLHVDVSAYNKSGIAFCGDIINISLHMRHCYFDVVLQKKTKRKRKPRYPKGYDPSKPNGGLPPPDPERWLPKWQRSDAKKKQKRRRDRQVGLNSRALSCYHDLLSYQPHVRVPSCAFAQLPQLKPVWS
jgi:signal recognition particle subunit SRP72